jgi:hypothetical protein
MSRLYLHCAICSRRQADGLISGAAWGRVEVPHDAEIALAYRGTILRVCPTCVHTHTDWQERLMTAVGFSPNGSRPT